MRILICNNAVRRGGGVDAVVALEVEALRSRGHEVVLYERSNDEFGAARGLRRLGLLASTLYSWRTRREVGRLVARERFDIAHVHNTVPLLTGAVYDALRRAGGPVIVKSLHNYWAACPVSYAFRDGAVCHLCAGRGGLPCVRHRCYHASRLQSAMLAAARAVDAAHGRPFAVDGDAYVAVSAYVRDRHAALGLPASRIHVLPNASRDLSAMAAPAAEPRPKLVYVGALVEAKGVLRLPALAARLGEFELHLIGGGDDRPRLERLLAAAGCSRVVLHGHLAAADAAAVRADAFLTVVPSICEETFGLVVAESYSLATPVLVSRAGGLPEIVEDGATGRIVDFADPAAAAAVVRQAWADTAARRRMRARARALFEERFTPARYADRLVGLLGELAAGPRGRGEGLRP